MKCFNTIHVHKIINGYAYESSIIYPFWITFLFWCYLFLEINVYVVLIIRIHLAFSYVFRNRRMHFLTMFKWSNLHGCLQFLYLLLCWWFWRDRLRNEYVVFKVLQYLHEHVVKKHALFIITEPIILRVHSEWYSNISCISSMRFAVQQIQTGLKKQRKDINLHLININHVYLFITLLPWKSKLCELVFRWSAKNIMYKYEGASLLNAADM